MRTAPRLMARISGERNTTAEPPVINIPPTQQIVPTWIYAVIGIGTALIVVVIVLIVRSRDSRT